MTATKGPWTIRPEAVGCLGVQTWEINADPPGRHWVAHTLTLEDARKVAAAPAMLAALEDLTAWVCASHGVRAAEQETDHPLRVAAEAIRAARGQV